MNLMHVLQRLCAKVKPNTVSIYTYSGPISGDVCNLVQYCLCTEYTIGSACCYLLLYACVFELSIVVLSCLR